MVKVLDRQEFEGRFSEDLDAEYKLIYPTPKEQLPKPDWERTWTNLDCDDEDDDEESDFYVWTVRQS